MSGHRLFQDDLASVSISRLRASGVVTFDTKSVEIVFGEGEDGLRRQVKVVHRRFPDGGEWSFATARRVDGTAKEVARAARRRAGEIAPEVRPQAGPPMVAYCFVA
jgi:hypothetical protein